MEAFDSSSDDDVPSFSKKNKDQAKPKATVKSTFMAEHTLWKVLTDIEMSAVYTKDLKEPPSEYQMGLCVAEKLKELEEEGSIPSVKEARSVMDSAERLCIKYMRAVLEPLVIKRLIAKDFPTRDFKSLLERVKNLCPEELEQYNMRSALRKQILAVNPSVSSPATPEKQPIHSNYESPTKPRTPQKKGGYETSPYSPKYSPGRSFEDRDEVFVVLPKVIDKFDMTKVKDPNSLIGQEIPFIKTTWQAYVGYQVYADVAPRLYLHKDSMHFLKSHGHFELPKLIKGKIKEIKQEIAKEDNRYELKEGDVFGIARLEFTTINK